MSSSSRKIISAIIAFLAILYVGYLLGQKGQIKVNFSNSLDEVTILTTEQQVDELIEKLAKCESSNNPRAVNFKDRDGTASFGYLQFKPESFKYYGVKYGFIGENASWDYIMTIIWDKEMQVRIAKRMIDDKKVDPQREWPLCWKKITKK